MKRLLIFLLLAVSAWAETLYVTQAGTTPFNGALATPFRASDFNTAGNWGAGAGKISADDTVILSGTFTTKLTVQGSGTSGHQILLKGDGALTGTGASPSWSGTTILVGIDGGAQDYIWLIGCEIRQTSTANSYAAINWAGAVGWLVEDNYIHTTYMNGIASGTGTNASNIVRHNWFDDIGGIAGGQGGGSNPDVMDFYGNAHLCEYNIVTKSMDRTRVLAGTGTVIRNNYWGATDTLLYPSSPQYPSHTDGLQSFGSAPLIQVLYEKNYDTDNQDSTVGLGGPNAHGLLIQDQTPVNTYKWMLDRFNLEIRTGSAGHGFERMNNVYGYNNTFVAIQNQEAGIGFTTVGYYTGTTDVGFWINNAFDYSPHTVISGGSGGSIDFAGAVTNAFNDYSQYDSTSGAVPTETHATMHSVAPLFTDGLGTNGHDNYTLQNASPMHGVAGVLTTANGAGTGSTSLTVQTGSARKFFSGVTGDGWPGVDGDWIKIGSGAYVQVTAVNTTTDVLTLGATRTWSSGDNVIVKGNEDTGALPYTYVPTLSTPTVTQTTATASPTSLTATTTTADSVRFVEFLVGKVPVGINYYDGDSSYTFTNTPSGPQTVEARAYNYWASATPTVSSYLLVNQDPSALAAGTPTTSTIPLTWTDNSAGVDTYSIETSTDNVTFVVNNVTAAGASSGTATGLASTTLYYAKIRALSGGVYSGYSGTVSATTASAGGSSAAGIGGKITVGGKVTIK